MFHQLLKGQAVDEEVRGLLVAPDFAQRDRSRAEAMRFLLGGGRRRLLADEGRYAAGDLPAAEPRLLSGAGGTGLLRPRHRFDVVRAVLMLT